MSGQKKLWSADFILLSIIGFFTTAVQLLLSATIALYVVHIGGQAGQAGALSVGFAMAAIVMRLWGGLLTDGRGRRFTMVLGTGIYLAGILGFMVSQQTAAMFFFRGLQGVGFSLANTAAGAAVADVLPKERIGEGLGYYGLWQAIAMALGPVIGLVLVGGSNYTFLFGSVAGIMLLTMALSFCVRYEKREHITYSRAKSAGKKNVPLEKKAAAPTVIQTMVTLCQASITGFFTLFAVSRGVESAGVFFVIQAAAMFLTRMFTGKIADKKGTLAVVIPGIFLGVIGYLLLMWAPGDTVLLLAGLFTGACVGIVQPALTAMAVKKSPADRKGAVNATFYLGMDIANGAGGYLWGNMIDLLGYAQMFGGCAALMAVAAVLSTVLLKKE